MVLCIIVHTKLGQQGSSRNPMEQGSKRDLLESKHCVMRNGIFGGGLAIWQFRDQCMTSLRHITPVEKNYHILGTAIDITCGNISSLRSLEVAVRSSKQYQAGL